MKLHGDRNTGLSEGVPDEALAREAAKGDESALEYLLEKYKSLVRAKARGYFLIGADREDIVQEGMIGLYKAIRDFDEQKQTSFRYFAEMCIRRQIITAIKTAARQKHTPLNTYISTSQPAYDDESGKPLIDILIDKNSLDPEKVMIDREESALLGNKIKNVLSSFELQVLSMYLQGKSYREIAEDLKRESKSIDNALQRLRSKIEKIFREEQ